MNPSAIELLDDVAIGRARANPAYRDSTRFVQGDPKAVLVVEWSGTKRSWTNVSRARRSSRRGRGAGCCRFAPKRRWARPSGSASPRCRFCSVLQTMRNRSPLWRTRPCRRTGWRSSSAASRRSSRRTVPGPASTATPAWDACTSGLLWTPRTRWRLADAAHRRGGRGPRRRLRRVHLR